jgi:plastocyanin
MLLAGGIAAGMACSSKDDPARPATGQGSDQPPETSIAVSIPSGATGEGADAYGTNPLTVDSNTTVTWTNDDSTEHTATSDSLIWDSGPIAPGESYAFRFTTPGTYPYHCATQGHSEAGAVEVRLSGTGGSGP